MGGRNLNIESINLVWDFENGTTEETPIYAEIESVGQKEFFEAAQKGFKAQHKLKIWEIEYNNQPFVKMGGKKYSVYRTQSKPNSEKIYLYLTDKLGAHK